MKRKNVCKVLAATFAMGLALASPMASIDSHAFGFNKDAHDDTDYGVDSRPDDYWDWMNEDSGSSDNGGSSSEEYVEPAPAPVVVEDNSHSDNGSSDNSSSYDSGASNSGVSDSGSSSSNASASASTTVSTAGKSNSATVSVTGGQKFRVVMNANRTTYQVYHCGINKASFTVTDKDGNVVAFSNVKLEQGADGLWYENITFAEGVDTKDFTVTATGDATYLSTTLGVSGIKINGVVALSTVPVTDAE